MKLLFIALTLIVFESPTYAKAFDFENLADLELISNQYSADGVHFENAIALTAGFSLNELDFPPHSGRVAIGDNNAPLQIRFTNPTQFIYGYFTYNTKLTLSAYDSFDTLIGHYVTLDASNLPYTSVISLNFSGVRRLQIAGEVNNAFILDDFHFTSVPVPAPAAIYLFLSGLIGLALSAKKSSSLFC